jgi:hypothetical protein
VLKRQNDVCLWCGHGLSPAKVNLVEREPGWIGLCWSCIRRYDAPEEHPYLRKCLDAQGR